MIALVCDTPYQLISAILVAERVAPGEPLVFFINTYLYFEEQTFGYSDGHPRVRQILYYGRKHMGAGRLLAGLARPHAMLKHINGYERGMDVGAIVASRTAYMATYLYNEYSRDNPGLPVYLIEEGIGEYTSNMVHTRFTKACAALGRKTHMDHIAKAFFSAPALYPYQTPFPVEKIPAMGAAAREVVEAVFGLENIRRGGNRLDARHCIFLSEPNSCEMKERADAAAYDAEESRIMDATADAAGREDIIIKVHPIDPNFKKEGIETFYTQLPMESLLLTMDCADKYFVSSMSTAMLTPKLLFDLEPRLIFTYKLLDKLLGKFLPDARRRRYYDFIEGVMGLYRDRGRVSAPEDMDGLAAAIRDARAGTKAQG
jgi:hypothetical protein